MVLIYLSSYDARQQWYQYHSQEADSIMALDQMTVGFLLNVLQCGRQMGETTILQYFNEMEQ